MFTIGNNELKQAKPLGEFILCDCGKRHMIRFGNKVLPDGTKEPSKLLSFYTCNGKSYLAGINEMDIRKGGQK